jgi:O-antigen/teichoic acid export membrane protein
MAGAVEMNTTPSSAVYPADSTGQSAQAGDRFLRPMVAIVDAESDASWLARGSTVVLIGGCLGQALGFCSQILLARLLGPADFGLYGIGWTLFRLVGPFATLGLNAGVIYSASLASPADTGRRRDVLVQSVSLGILAGTLIGGIAYLSAPWLCADVFGKSALTRVIRGFALALPLLTGLTVASAATKLSLSMTYSTVVEGLIQPGLNLLFLVAALYFLDRGLMGAIAATTFSYALSLLAALFFVWILFSRILRSSARMQSYLSELLGFSVPASIAGSFVNLINRVDRLVIGAFLPAREVGIYQAASQTSTVFDIVPNIFNSVVAARVSDLCSRRELDRLEELYKLGAKWSFYLTMPLFLVVCAAPSGIMNILYGVHYQEGAWPLLVMCLGLMSDAVIGAASPILIFSGNQKLAGSISSSALIGAIALNFLLVPRLGMLGGAISTALAEAGMLCGLLIAVKMRLNLWPYDRRCLKGLVAAGCAALALAVLRIVVGASTQPLLIQRLLVAGVVFWLVLFLLGLDPEDKAFLSRKAA